MGSEGSPAALAAAARRLKWRVAVRHAAQGSPPSVVRESVIRTSENPTPLLSTRGGTTSAPSPDTMRASGEVDLTGAALGAGAGRAPTRNRSVHVDLAGLTLITTQALDARDAARQELSQRGAALLLTHHTGQTGGNRCDGTWHARRHSRTQRAAWTGAGPPHRGRGPAPGRPLAEQDCSSHTVTYRRRVSTPAQPTRTRRVEVPARDSWIRHQSRTGCWTLGFHPRRA